MERSNNFYKAIGKLFYAIAVVDTTIHPVELKTIKKVIGKKWVLNNKDNNVIIPQGSIEILKSFNAMLQVKTPVYMWKNSFSLSSYLS